MVRNKTEIFIREGQESLLISSLKQRDIYLINAISGSGKTTFILNFMKRKNFEYKYITLSEEDNDPINFFQKINSNFKNLALPVLTTDFLQNISIFSKKYFKSLLKGNFYFLILDDLHTIKAGKYTSEILNQLIVSFINSGKKLIFISKEDLEITYFPWDIEKNIFRIDTNFFKFSKKDIKKYFFNIYKKDLTNKEIDSIIHSTDGIVAKILLISNLDKNFESFYKDIEVKLLNLIGFKNLKILSKIYPFPEINEKVLSFFEEKEIIKELLEILYMENVLVSKTNNGYKLHDILQEFLLVKAKYYFSENYVSFINKIADVLYNLGYISKSIDLLKEIGNFKKISEILEKHLIDFIYEGRLYSVQKFLSIIENTNYMENPLFLFAKGFILKFEYPEEAIRYFSKALEVFKANNNIQGEKLVIGELFDLVQFYGEDFEIGGKYLSRAEELIKNTQNFSKVDIRLISYMGIIYLLYEGNAQKSYYYFNMLNKIIGHFSGSKPVFFSYIKLYSAITYSAVGKSDEAEEVFKEACEIYKLSSKNPNDIFMFNFLSSMYEVFVGNFEKAIEKGKIGLDIINEWNLLKHKEHMISRLVRGLLCVGNVKSAKKYIEEIKSLPFRTSFSKGVTYQLETQMYLIENNFDLAEEKAIKSIELFSKVNSKIFEMATNSLLAVVYIEKGYYKEAENILKEVIKWAKETGGAIQEFTSLIHLSYLYIKQGKEELLKLSLNNALKLAKNRKIKAIYYQYPHLIKSVLLKALELNIEPNYSNYLLKFHNLQEQNTFKVKIYTFGKLKVVVNGEEIINWYGTKTLSLLKAIIALGGENIPVDNIINLIWDENDYKKSKQNFEFTLRKLRKILKDERKEILQLKNNRVSLNKSLVWLDLWKFEELCLNLELTASKFGKNNIGYKNLLSELKSLYRGKFLEIEKDIFIDNIRLKLDNKFKKFSIN
ncbi:AAA family ATPase [Persephonella sp.]